MTWTDLDAGGVHWVPLLYAEIKGAPAHGRVDVPEDTVWPPTHAYTHATMIREELGRTDVVLVPLPRRLSTQCAKCRAELEQARAMLARALERLPLLEEPEDATLRRIDRESKQRVLAKLRAKIAPLEAQTARMCGEEEQDGAQGIPMTPTEQQHDPDVQAALERLSRGMQRIAERILQNEELHNEAAGPRSRPAAQERRP